MTLDEARALKVGNKIIIDGHSTEKRATVVACSADEVVFQLQSSGNFTTWSRYQEYGWKCVSLELPWKPFYMAGAKTSVRQNDDALGAQISKYGGGVGLYTNAQLIEFHDQLSKLIAYMKSNPKP